MLLQTALMCLPLLASGFLIGFGIASIISNRRFKNRHRRTSYSPNTHIPQYIRTTRPRYK